MDSAVEGIAHEPFGEMPDGTEVTRCTLTNRRGSVARLIDLGATLTELWMPDRGETLGDVVLGFESVEAYAINAPYLRTCTGTPGTCSKTARAGTSSSA